MEKIVGKFAKAMQLASMHLRENIKIVDSETVPGRKEILRPYMCFKPVVHPRCNIDPDALGEGIDKPSHIPSMDAEFELDGLKLKLRSDYGKLDWGYVNNVTPVEKDGVYVAWNIVTDIEEVEYSILIPTWGVIGHDHKGNPTSYGYDYHIFKCTEEDLVKYNGTNHDIFEMLLKYNNEVTQVQSPCGKYTLKTELGWMSGSPCVYYSDIDPSLGTKEERDRRAKKLYIKSIERGVIEFHVVAYEAISGVVHTFTLAPENI